LVLLGSSAAATIPNVVSGLFINLA
jgi:hypothetical protein